MHDLFVYPRGTGESGDTPSYLLEGDAKNMARLAKLVTRYRLRANVNIRKIEPGEMRVWHAWDDTAVDSGSGSGSGNNRWSSVAGDSTITMRDPRAPGLGYRIIQLNDKTPPVDLEMAPEVSYTIRRYLEGVAEGHREIVSEAAMPLESNMDIMNGIDLHKGCYVGQELTIRTKHRGVVRKRILPCVIYEAENNAPPPEALTYEPAALPSDLSADRIPEQAHIGYVETMRKGAGRWLTGVGNIGLALCRLGFMTDVALPDEQASLYAGRVDSEFAVQWDEGTRKVKVKAFVPDWMRAEMGQPKR